MNLLKIFLEYYVCLTLQENAPIRRFLLSFVIQGNFHYYPVSSKNLYSRKIQF